MADGPRQEPWKRRNPLLWGPQLGGPSCAGCREFARRRESPFGVLAGPRGPGGVHARDARIMSARAECTRLGSFGAGVRTTAFLPPRYTAKTATRVRSSAEHIETPCRSRQNTGRPTGETRACDVATAGVTAGKSGDYATVDVSRVTNRKLVAGNGQTAPGRIHDLVGIGSEAEQHCPPAQQGDPLLDAINPRAECFPSQKHMDHRSRSLRRVGEEGLSESIRKMFQLSHTPFGALSRDALW